MLIRAGVCAAVLVALGSMGEGQKKNVCTDVAEDVGLKGGSPTYSPTDVESCTTSGARILTCCTAQFQIWAMLN